LRIIRSDDENFPSRPSFVSRSLKLLQQHGRTPFSV